LRVKRLAALLTALLVQPTWAQELAVPQGYAFDQPQVLADQRVWGIAHGARLLALACARAGHGAAAEAWVDWQERESAQIEVIRAALGQYYFKTDDAPLDAVANALGLSASLSLPPEALAPACGTLAEALAQPRYDLAKRRDELMKK
jgi:hypothetical protein